MLYRRGNIWWTEFEHAGDRFRLSTGETDRRIAEKRARQIRVEVELAAGPRQRPGLDLELLQGLDLARSQQQGLGGRRGETLRGMWGHLLAHLGGPYRDATTLTLADVDAYEGARRGKARGQTIRREVQSLVRGLRLAKRAGMIDAMPFDPDDLRIISSDPPKPTQQAKAWTPEEIAAVLANLSAKAITAGIGDQMRLVQVTGLRYTELKRLRASWVDGATLTVPAIDGAKTRTPRIVPLGSEALAILQKWLARSDAPFQGGKPNAALALASIRAGFANGVVPTEGPMRGKATMVSGRVLTPRDLRASYITQAGRHDPVAAQLLAGHTSIKTTSRYLHAHQDRLLAAARAAENASKVPTVGSPQQNRVVKKAQ